MKRPLVPVWAWCGVSIAALCGLGYWLFQSSVAEENALVEWALRLPEERERARIAGFSGDRRIAPNFDPAKDAGGDWVRIEAVMRADAPEGELPYGDDLLRYANPPTRTKAKRSEVKRLLKKYRSFLADAERASRKPLCHFPYHKGNSDLDGAEAAELLAMLHLASAVEERGRGRAQTAMGHAATALRIAHQLQAHNTIYPYTSGITVETIVLRFVCEGLTGRDAVTGTAWERALTGHETEFLRPQRNEPLPAAQFRNLIHNDHLLMREIIRGLRAEKYKPRQWLFMESAPVLRSINRLDFVLSLRTAADALEASADWCYAGLAVRLRACETETRPYVLWKAMEGWARHVAIVMRKSPRLVGPHKWEHIPWRRTVRDTDRALAQAVWGQVSGKGAGRVPDDPFAAKPNVPLHRRDLPDGSMLWYSVGDNGTDDGGEESKDRVVKVWRK